MRLAPRLPAKGAGCLPLWGRSAGARPRSCRLPACPGGLPGAGAPGSGQGAGAVGGGASPGGLAGPQRRPPTPTVQSGAQHGPRPAPARNPRWEARPGGRLSDPSAPRGLGSVPRPGLSVGPAGGGGSRPLLVDVSPPLPPFCPKPYRSLCSNRQGAGSLGRGRGPSRPVRFSATRRGGLRLRRPQSCVLTRMSLPPALAHLPAAEGTGAPCRAAAVEGPQPPCPGPALSRLLHPQDRGCPIRPAEGTPSTAILRSSKTSHAYGAAAPSTTVP